MDALVVSRSLRALLAFAQSSIASTRGVTLLVLKTTALVEMLVGMSSREASTTLALAWDEVSTSQSGPSGFWGRVIGTTTWLGLLKVEFLDPEPDVFSIAWDRRFLTSTVMLPSNLGGIYGNWLPQWWRPHQEAIPFWSCSSTGGGRISIPK